MSSRGAKIVVAAIVSISVALLPLAQSEISPVFGSVRTGLSCVGNCSSTTGAGSAASIATNNTSNEAGPPASIVGPTSGPNATAPLPSSPCSSNCTWSGVPSPSSGNQTSGPIRGDSAKSTASSGPRPSTWSSNLYWFTTKYGGTNYTQSHNVQVEYTSVFLPSSGPHYGDAYFLLLSDFDSLGYYDQLGVASCYGSACGGSGDYWTINYSQGWSTSTAACAYAGNLNNLAYNLGQFGWYTFVMYLSGTNLVFKAYSGDGVMNGSTIWSQSFGDSASSFEVGGTFTGCHGGYDHSTGYSFTVYQEVHNIGTGNTMSVPQWDFWFDQTNVAWWGSGSWNIVGISDSTWTNWCVHTPAGTCPTPPHGYVIADYNRYVAIANEALWLDWSANAYSFAPGGGFSQVGTEQALGSYCPNNSCTVSMTCGVPSGWSGGGSYSTPLSNWLYDGYSAYSPTTASAGNYYPGCDITLSSSSPNEYTTFVWYITVT